MYSTSKHMNFYVGPNQMRMYTQFLLQVVATTVVWITLVSCYTIIWFREVIETKSSGVEINCILKVCLDFLRGESSNISKKGVVSIRSSIHSSKCVVSDNAKLGSKPILEDTSGPLHRWLQWTQEVRWIPRSSCWNLLPVYTGTSLRWTSLEPPLRVSCYWHRRWAGDLITYIFYTPCWCLQEIRSLRNIVLYRCIQLEAFGVFPVGVAIHTGGYVLRLRGGALCSQHFEYRSIIMVMCFLCYAHWFACAIHIRRSCMHGLLKLLVV